MAYSPNCEVDRGRREAWRAARRLILRSAPQSRLLGGDLAKLGHFLVELKGGQRWLDGNSAQGRVASVPAY